MQFYNTGDLPADLAKRSFALNIARIFPNGEAPLFAMSGLAKKKMAKQIMHGYWSKTANFAKVTIDGAHTNVVTTINVDDSSSVLPNDLLQVTNAFSGGNYVAPELIRVIAKPSATTLTVERGFAGTTARALVDNEVLPAVGNAHPEASAKPVARAITPVLQQNYTQIFRNAWAQGKTLAAVKQEVGKGTISENRDDASFFHSRDIELATFFGRKSMTTDSESGEPLHTMDGIEALIEANAPSNLKEAGATTSYTQLINLLDPVFDQKTNMMTGNSRVMYVGKEALKVINEIGRLSGEYRIVNKQNSFGLKFTEIQLPRGTVQMIEHPIFNTHTEWQKMAVIADLSSFDFAYLEGRDTEVTFINQDKNSTDGTDASGGVLTTELTIELQNPFAWGIIYGFTAAAA